MVVLVMARSTEVAEAIPPLPLLSLLLVRFGSASTAETVVALSNAPAALIVAVAVIVTFAPIARLAIVQGSAQWPPRGTHTLPNNDLH